MIDFQPIFKERFGATLPVLSHRQKVFEELQNEFEKQLYQYALRCSMGNVKKAASYLNVNRNTVRKRCEKHGIDADSFRAEHRVD